MWDAAGPRYPSGGRTGGRRAQRDLRGREAQDHPKSHGGGWRLQPWESSLGRQNPAERALHRQGGQTPVSVFTLCNLTLDGEEAVCIFIWEICLGEESCLVCKLQKCISPQRGGDQARAPGRRLAQTQPRVSLTGALSSDGFCWSNSPDRPLLDLPCCSQT